MFMTAALHRFDLPRRQAFAYSPGGLSQSAFVAMRF
jgi:hypothetical protein